MKPVCLVLGAGTGIGGHVGMRFAREGDHAVLCRRTDRAGLDRPVGEIEAAGGAATGFLVDAALPDTVEDRVAAVEEEIGPIEVAVFNLGTHSDRRWWSH